MNVNVLKQFLHSLVAPLRATPQGEAQAAQLEQACACLDPFAQREVADLAEFLRRAQGYERDGNWPVFRPAIAGELVDEPTSAEYASRLRTYLQRHVQPGVAIADKVKFDLKQLEKRLTPAVLREVAHDCGVDQPSATKSKALEQIVHHVTGQSLAAKKPKAALAATGYSAEILDEIAKNLQTVAGTPDAAPALEKLKADRKMNAALLKVIAEKLELPVPAKPAKPALLKQLGAFLARAADSREPPPAHEGQIERFAEIVLALKAKADLPGCPTEEIQAELRSLEQQLNKEDAVALVRRLGIVRPVATRQEAFEAIQRKVFEAKRAREAIAF